MCSFKVTFDQYDTFMLDSRHIKNTFIMKIGYARVSSSGQCLDSQLESLKNYGVEKIFKEKVSGTSTKGRDELKKCLEFVREGDEFVITRIDRCSRSILDLQLIVNQLKEKGVSITATEQPISNKDATGKCFMDMLGVFAEFETNLRHERQMEGIKIAKEKGKFKGKQASIDVKKIKILKDEGVNPTDIARQMNISRGSVYRLMKKVEV